MEKQALVSFCAFVDFDAGILILYSTGSIGTCSIQFENPEDRLSWSGTGPAVAMVGKLGVPSYRMFV